jgi:nitroreductase
VNAEEIIISYHERTKHHFHRFAASLGYLDWATQPDPFRRYAGAPLVRLPLARGTPASIPYRCLFSREGVSDRIEPASLSIDSISLFFRCALSLTAWKEYGGVSWALRANPSSGNLHPTEGYVILPATPGIHDSPAAYHYAPLEHALERRADLDPIAWQRWAGSINFADTIAGEVAGVIAGPADLGGQRDVASGSPSSRFSFLFGLTSVHWREAGKYGERAYRYCQHDVGHALAAARIAAAVLGWKLVLLDGVGDGTIARLLGIDREMDFAGAEREHPDLLALVIPCGDDLAHVRASGMPSDVAAARVASLARLSSAAGSWRGTANVLSPTHAADWPLIDEVADAAWREDGAATMEDMTPRRSSADLGDDSSEHAARRAQGSVAPSGAVPSSGSVPSSGALATSGSGAPYPDSVTAERVILGRRSAVGMDCETSISAEVFYRILARLLPYGMMVASPGDAMRSADFSTPWDAIPWRPRIHLGIFVHRVQGLAPGIYILIRDPEKTGSLREAMRGDFAWQRPEVCPPQFDFYLLRAGDCRDLAAGLSCGQNIAADGAFSVAMIAEYEASLVAHRAAFYRNLFWEAGMIGQMIYLEAEAAGIRGTGIGCYFDDPVHQLLGIRSREWQSLYHFTVGGAVEDTRLTTRPGYEME